MRRNSHFSLNEVVSVEAWYARFSEETKESEFFLHVRFQDAVFGNEAAHPVRFKLRLKKAHITIVPEEPVRVPRRSVRRDRIQVEAKRTIEEHTDLSLSGAAHAEGAISPLAVTGKAGVKGEASGSKGRKETSSHTITHSGMLIEHSVDVEQNNRWSFTPAVGEHLIGQAFNDTTALLSILHDAPLAKIPPTVKVRVACLREDIDVLELEAKEEVKGFLKRGIGEEKKLKLAEEMIKSALEENGLEFDDVGERFSHIVVADVIATEE